MWDMWEYVFFSLKRYFNNYLHYWFCDYKMKITNLWVKPGQGGGYNGWMKIRKTPVLGEGTREQNRKFRKLVESCKGKSRSEFLLCMSK